MKGQRLFIASEAEIPEFLKKETNKDVRFRLAFLNALIKLSLNLELTCDIFSIATPTGYAWIQSWNDFGHDGLSHPFHSSNNPPGPRPSLDDSDIDLLGVLLSSKDNWKIGEVKELIEDNFGIDLSESQIGRILKNKLGMYFSKPYPHDYRRPDDAEEQLANSLKNAFNTLINKGIDISEIAIGFIDETSPQTTSNTVRMWHMDRHSSIIKNTTRYKANAVGFYALQGDSVQKFMIDSKAKSFSSFIEDVSDKNRDYKAMIIILDNFSTHHAVLVRETAANNNIEFVYLPKYSPDLNPIEFIWKTVKRTISSSFIKSLADMKEAIFHTWSSSSGNCSFAKKWIDEFLPEIFPYREICG